MRDEAESLKRQIEQMAAIASELDEVREQLKEALHERDALAEPHQRLSLSDLELVRDRILANLYRRVGKQSPEYKRTKSVLDNFIDEVEREAD